MKADSAAIDTTRSLPFRSKSHPILSSLGQEAAAEESSEVPARNAGSDEPYRDSPSRPSSPLEDPQDHHQLMQDQRKIFDQQDSQLDTLSLSIGRQRDLSLRMNEELELQSDLLDDLDQDVERTGLRLGRASGQLDRVRRKVKDHGECQDPAVFAACDIEITDGAIL